LANWRPSCQTGVDIQKCRRATGVRYLPFDSSGDQEQHFTELAHTAGEGGSHNKMAAGSEAAAAQTIPMVPSPHASLMARLDRLGGPAKEVAQIGAASQ
jgi:hypothetical protein